jgi:hypothetical protein
MLHLTAPLASNAGKVHQLFRWLANGGSHVPPAQQRYSVRLSRAPSGSASGWVPSGQATAPARQERAAENAPVGKTGPQVRVLRVVEGSQPLKAAGRMRISGRMADVCAELDRLAA